MESISLQTGDLDNNVTPSLVFGIISGNTHYCKSNGWVCCVFQHSHPPGFWAPVAGFALLWNRAVVSLTPVSKPASDCPFSLPSSLPQGVTWVPPHSGSSGLSLSWFTIPGFGTHFRFNPAGFIPGAPTYKNPLFWHVAGGQGYWSCPLAPPLGNQYS